MRYLEVLSFARELRRNQTKAETVFWSKVRNRKFHGFKFNRQFIIEHENAHFFIADFHCYERKLIVQVDGKIHLKRVEEDKSRDIILSDLGYTTLRFKNDEVLNNWAKVEEKLLQYLKLNPQENTW